MNHLLTFFVTLETTTMSLNLFRSTVPKQSPTMIIAATGCVALIVGARTIVKALNAGKHAADLEMNEDGCT